MSKVSKKGCKEMREEGQRREALEKQEREGRGWEKREERKVRF